MKNKAQILVKRPVGFPTKETWSLEESLIPSVKRYCNKYNYDYKMITDWPDDYDVKWFNRNESKNKATTLIRYLNMDQPEYDRIVLDELIKSLTK